MGTGAEVLAYTAAAATVYGALNPAKPPDIPPAAPPAPPPQAAKSPDLTSILANAQNSTQNGPGSTFLAGATKGASGGPPGVDPSSLTLSKSTLLGS